MSCRTFVLWGVMPCSVVEVYWCFRGKYCLCLQGWRVSQANKCTVLSCLVCSPILKMELFVYHFRNQVMSSSVVDVHRYVIIRKLLDSFFSILMVFIQLWKIQGSWLMLLSPDGSWYMWLMYMHYLYSIQTLFFKERMNISDYLYKLRITYSMSLRHTDTNFHTTWMPVYQDW